MSMLAIEWSAGYPQRGRPPRGWVPCFFLSTRAALPASGGSPPIGSEGLYLQTLG